MVFAYPLMEDLLRRFIDLGVTGSALVLFNYSCLTNLGGRGDGNRKFHFTAGSGSTYGE